MDQPELTASLSVIQSPMSMEVSEMDLDTFGTFDEHHVTVRPTPQARYGFMRTPTTVSSRACASNVSSVTCMKYGDLEYSSERDTMMKATPLRDLLPEDQEHSIMQCPMSADSEAATSDLSDSMNKENESPQSAQVVSPATAFRLKRAVFESAARAVKSPARRTKALNVSAVDLTPTTVVTEFSGAIAMELSATPNSAIQCETEEPRQQDEVEPEPAAPTAVPLLESKASNEVSIDQSIVLEEEKEAAKALEDMVATKQQALAHTTTNNSSSQEEHLTPTQSDWRRLAFLLAGAFCLAVLALRGAWGTAPQAKQLAVMTVTSDLSGNFPSPAPAGTFPQDDSLTITTEEEMPVYHELLQVPSQASEPTVQEYNYWAVAPQEPSALDEVKLLLSDLKTVASYQLATWKIHAENLLQQYRIPQRTRKMRRTLRKWQRQVQPVMHEVVAAVLAFHYPTSVQQLQGELTHLQEQLVAQGEKIQERILSAREHVYEKAPFLPAVERAVAAGVSTAHRGLIHRLQQAHCFIKEHALLPEVYAEG